MVSLAVKLLFRRPNVQTTRSTYSNSTWSRPYWSPLPTRRRRTRSSTNRFANRSSAGAQAFRRSSSEPNRVIAQGLRDSLAAHGDVVLGEFPALDAVAAKCIAKTWRRSRAFISTDSVSVNGPVAVQALGLASRSALTLSALQTPLRRHALRCWPQRRMRRRLSRR